MANYLPKPGWPPHKPCTLREMSEVEAAYVGCALDTDGMVRIYYHPEKPTRHRRTYTANVALQELEVISACLRATGIGTVCYNHVNRTWRWAVQRRHNFEALVRRCAPYSVKCQEVLNGCL